MTHKPHGRSGRPALFRGFLAATLGFALGPAAAHAQSEIPDYYPTNYSKIVEASKQEDGLLIYSNMAEYNWAPVIEAFNQHYPWIEIQTLDLGSAEVFTRYNVESGSNARTADLLATGSIEGWLRFAETGGIMEYESPEADKVPEWSRPMPGVYTISTDPMVIVYNKLVVPETDWPESMADIASLAREKPEEYANSLTTYSVDVPYGQPIHYEWATAKGDEAWEMIEAFAPLTVPEDSAGTMLSKLSAGEYKIGYFVSGIVVFPKYEGARTKLLGWSFPKDGTPLVMRSVAVPKQSTNVNSAKLMLDFILSHEGQVAFGNGGLTPYRDGVTMEDVAHYTYGGIADEVGEENIILVDYEQDFLKDAAAFSSRWNEAAGR